MPADHRQLDATMAAVALERIERQFHMALGECGESEETPGYRVFVLEKPDPFYRHVAVPVTAEALDGRHIARMVKVFEARGLRANLEFVAQRWPALADCLQHHGLKASLRLPLMVSHQVQSEPYPDQSVHIVLINRSSAPPHEITALVYRYLDAANRAFGAEVGHSLKLECHQLCRALDVEQALLSIALIGDNVVAGACLSGIGVDAEMVGVWTLPDHRRQGLGECVCRILLGRFFDRGGRMVWLSAPNAEGQSLYQRLGFQVIGQQLTMTAA